MSLYLHSINATPPETGTVKETCRWLKMEAMLLYITFGELPEPFVIRSDEGRGSKRFGQVAGEQIHNLTLIGFCLGISYNMPHISSGSTTIIREVCFGDQPGLNILPKKSLLLSLSHPQFWSIWTKFWGSLMLSFSFSNLFLFGLFPPFRICW